LIDGNRRVIVMKMAISLFTFGVLVDATQEANAIESSAEVAACVLSPSDMLRQPKNMPPVLADSTFNCGKQGEHTLARLYENGWRLIQVLPNGAFTNPWIGIFERQKQ
jgi:hypothetical protein